jgi:amino acid adenylation domain-containing protein
MRRALGEIVRRHEVLRASFVTLGETAGQAVAPSLDIDLSPIDLGHLSGAERDAEATRLTDEEAHRAFDLGRGPLIRASLLRLDADEHILMVTVHHIASDGWSFGLFIHEMEVLYRAFLAGEPSPLPELQIQYADFAAWQRDWMRGEVLQTQLAYWKKQLGGLAPLELPGDRPRPPVQTFRGTSAFHSLPREVLDGLKALSRREGATLYMTMLAAFKTLLCKYSGQEDIAVGCAIAGRNRAEVEPLIGFFINMLVMRTDLGGDPLFTDLIRRVRETTLGAYAHQDLPFEAIVSALRPERDASRTPLFQVVLTEQTDARVPDLPGLGAAHLSPTSRVARFDLSMNYLDTPDELSLGVEYSTDIFEAATIERLFRHFETLLRAIAENPDRRLSELPLLETEERRRMLVEWNRTELDYPRKCIHQLFEERVDLAPEGLAAIFEDQSLTYGELDRRSNRLARYLRSLGVGSETLVGVCVERSLEMVVAIMGVLKAGGAYIPLDPDYPAERLAFMLEDTQAPVLLTQERLTGGLPETGARVVRLDLDWAAIEAETGLAGDERLPNVSKPDGLAYVIYTSGSTGKPKGVLIEHHSVANFTQTTRILFEVTPKDRILQFASLCFDVSVFEIFTALLSGATLVLGSRETLLSPPDLTALMQREGVTITDLPPAVMALLPGEEFPALRVAFVGGEAFSGDLVNRWVRPGRTFYNGYGPTEGTVTVIIYKCEGSWDRSPPIGKPMYNQRAYVVDKSLHPVPVGVPGELCLGGAGLARGYLKRPELTAEKFIRNPFVDNPKARIYRTGDLVKYLANGDIEFLGRIDSQVKIRGFRIELGEVEAALAQHPGLKQVVVLAREDTPGHKRLVAYVVPEADGPSGPSGQGEPDEPGGPSVSELRSFLGERVPAYMIPAAFVTLEALPITSSGKVDHRALPAPEGDRPDLDQGFVAPRTETERALAGEVFASILVLEEVGANDNFFELGGNSLQATQVIARIRSLFGVQLPLRSIFDAPTVAALAEVIEAAGGATKAVAAPRPATPSPALEMAKKAADSCLMPIQRRGARPPVFFIHPISGTVFCYATLARVLGPDQPFYGLQALGLEDTGEGLPLSRIEDMAEVYLTAIRSVQPEGPYLLGGWSMGGMIALAVAAELARRGGRVDLLAILDATAPGHAGGEPVEGEVPASFARDLNALFGVETSLREEAFVGLSSEESVSLIRDEASRAGILPPEMTLAELGRRLDVFGANALAGIRYSPAPYPGKASLFMAAESPDTRRLWRESIPGDLDACVVPGNHYTMLASPQVEVLASELAKRILVATKGESA